MGLTRVETVHGRVYARSMGRLSLATVITGVAALLSLPLSEASAGEGFLRMADARDLVGRYMHEAVEDGIGGTSYTVDLCQRRAARRIVCAVKFHDFAVDDFGASYPFSTSVTAEQWRGCVRVRSVIDDEPPPWHPRAGARGGTRCSARVR